MKQKIRVGLLFGGKSVEHEVSISSARNVAAALRGEKFDVTLIGIDKNGRWHLSDASKLLQHAGDQKMVCLPDSKERVTVVFKEEERQLVSLSGKLEPPPLDVIFPILHGTCGEDGTVQGLLKLIDIPFVGSGVLSSAISMDKDVMKRLFQQANLPTANFVMVKSYALDQVSFEEITKKLGLPFFVKPANSGSSVGVHKIKEEKDFLPALQDASQYDRKILIEEFISGREIECSVLGNDDPIASLPGEIIPTHEFYSYAAKYLDENGAILKVPAELDDKTIEAVQKLAILAYKTLECEGMARVDFFLKKDGSLLLNEVNTIPGFTNISMFPKLWEASGINCEELVERLIDLAIERHQKEKQLKVSYE